MSSSSKARAQREADAIVAEFEKAREQLPKGFAHYWTERGALLTKVMFWSDPSKADANYVRTELLERGWDPDSFRIEMLGDERIRFGKPVYVAYRDALHNPLEWRGKPFPVVEGSAWFGGWDAGDTLQPAFVVLQVTPKGQILQMGEVVAPEGMDADSFCPLVRNFLDTAFPTVYAIRHGGDQTIGKRVGTDGRTVRQIMRRHGFTVRPMTNVWAVRKAAVSRALLEHVEVVEREGAEYVVPRFLVSELTSPVTVEGFRGSYKLPDLPENVEPDSPDAVQRMMPVKNHPWSDVHDALQYGMMMAMDHVHRSVRTTYEVNAWNENE